MKELLTSSCRDQGYLLCSNGFLCVCVWRRKCRSCEDFFYFHILLKARLLSFSLFLSEIVQSTLVHNFYQSSKCADSRRAREQWHPNPSRLWKLCAHLSVESLCFLPLFSNPGLLYKSLLLNSDAPAEWCNYGHVSFILSAYSANFNKQ